MLAVFHLITRLLSLIDEHSVGQNIDVDILAPSPPIWHPHAGNSRIFPRGSYNVTHIAPRASVYAEPTGVAVSGPPSKPVTSLQLESVPGTSVTNNETDQLAVSSQAGPQRDVYTITDIWLQDKSVSPIDGVVLFTAHSSLQIAGSNLDGPLLVEIGDESHSLDSSVLHIRVLESPVVAQNNVSSTSAGRFLARAGTTTLRNRDFLDPETGAGLVADSWATDALYRTGQADVNEAVQLIHLILGKLGIAVPPESVNTFSLSNRWHAEIAHTVNTYITDLYYDFADSDNNGTATRAKFRINETTSGSPAPFSGPEFPPELGESPSFNSSSLPAIPTGFYLSLPEYDLEQALIHGGVAGAARAGQAIDSALTSPETPSIDSSLGKVATVSRISGTLSTLSVVAKEVAAATGFAGIGLGASIVVLDFIHGNWVGGGWAIGGLTAGIAIGLVDAGPIGWLIGGFVAALFAILPGLFEKKYLPGPVGQTEKIIQWKMFGDRDHTGNEACRANNATYHGNPNCTAVYGPGTMSAALGVEIYYIVALFLHFNNGYPMTIPDFAKIWHVINPGIYEDGADAIATIDCGDPPKYYQSFAGDTTDPDWLCNHPTFAIKLDLINIPVINQPASTVYNRLLPAPNADCAVLTFPGSQAFPQYNISVNGLPSVVACNLSSALNVSGVAVTNPAASPVSSASASSAPAPSQSGSLISSGSSSSDGQSGHHVAAPLPVPFQLLNSSNSICISGPQGSIKNPPPKKDPPMASLCLPPGTYDGQINTFGFQTSFADTLSLPGTTGYSVATHWMSPQLSHASAHAIDSTYTTNLTSSNRFFGSLYGLTDPRTSDQSLVVASPLDPPVICLFTLPSFHGDVACFGLGGGDLPDNVKGKAQSVSCHGGVSAWLYVAGYGEAFGVLVSGAVDDLRQEAYGKGNLANKVTAMWVKTN